MTDSDTDTDTDTDTDICGRTARSTGDPCQRPAGWGTDSDSGACKFHGGASSGAPEDNDNAVTHGAFADHFTADLTQAEEAALDDVVEQLDDPAGAQDIARMTAGVALLQFRRSGDERFLRRFESLCDKFEIAPTEELEVSGEGINIELPDSVAEF